MTVVFAMLYLSTTIGGIFLGWLCGLLINQLVRFYEADVRLPLGWPSAIGGLVTLSLAWRFGFSPEFFVYTALFFVLGIAAGIDSLLCILPDCLTVGGMVVALPVSILLLGIPWQHALTGSVVGVLSLGGLYFVSLKKHGHAGIGLGDVKLMACLGALCGVQALPQIWLVAIVSAFPMILRTKKVPFGPCLIVGAWSWAVMPWTTALRT